MDYYAILGVEKTATEADIKKAYRKLAQKYHPDTGKGDEAKFKEVTEAYEVLSDKQKRGQYDQFGKAGMGGGAGFGGFNFGGFEGGSFNFGGVDLGDMFENFFGGGGRRHKQGPQAGNSIEMVVQISFEEAIFGTSKEIELARYEICEGCSGNGAEPGSALKTCEDCSGTGQKIRVQRTPLGQIQTAAICPTCQGAGKKPEKKCKTCAGEGRTLKTSRIKAKIPAGIHDRAVIRLKEKGEAGTQGGGYGDLFLHISVNPSHEFERQKDDLFSVQKIHVLQAILGDEITVKTVHGPALLKIPAGTESGKVFKLKSYGVPQVGRDARGDHHVKVLVEMPKKLSGKEKKLYDELVQEAGLSLKPQSRGLFS